MKNVIFALMFVTCLMNGQTSYLKVKNDLKQSSRSIKDAFTAVNHEDGSFAVFIDDNKTFNGYLYANDKSPLGKVSSEGLPNRYENIIGYTVSDKQVMLYFQNKHWSNKFGSILFDFETETSSVEEFELEGDDEAFIESYSTPDNLYIIRLKRRKSEFIVHKIGHSNKRETLSFDYGDKHFVDDSYRERSLYKLLVPVSLKRGGEIVKLDFGTPNSIENASSPNKFYDFSNGFMITIDKNNHSTYVFVFDPKTDKMELNTISKPKLDKPSELDVSNSYFSGNKIFLVTGSRDQMIFTVKDRNTLEEIKQLKVNRDEDITFKNSPIIQEGGAYDDYREFEKTSKFLRKIAAHKIGVVAYKADGNYQVVIGGKQEMASGGGMMMMGGFGGMGMATSGAFAVSFNPIFYGFNSYTHSKSTRIECLFDQSFKHIDGETERNIFDRIKEFSDRINNSGAEDIFRINDDYFYGTYLPNDESFHIARFEP